MPTNRLRVLVLCGGKSAEHRVSLVSAKLILENLDKSKFSPELVFIDPQGRWLKADTKRLSGKVETKEKKITAGSKALASSEHLARPQTRPDVVFPALHGPMGEDGAVQGLFELAGVAYVGCGVLGSAVGMDKEVTKKLALQAGIPILPYRAAHNAQEARQAPAQLGGYPLFIKPARLGSSVGVSKVKSEADLEGAIATAFQYDDKILVEKGVDAREIECALLGDPWCEECDPLKLKASLCGEIVPRSEFYDYEAKYINPDGARLVIPAAVAAETMRQIQEWGVKAFQALDGYGMARADFLMDKTTGSIYFNEINTIPGFTPSSMYHLMWKASGLPLRELLSRLIELALRRHQLRSKLKTMP